MQSGRIRHTLILVGCIITLVPCYGQFQFSDITEDAGIDHHYLSVDHIGGGAAFFDMDNDGDEDLWISGGMRRDVLYENDGTGNFTEIGLSAGLSITNNIVTTGVITGDLDNDGFKDVMLLTHIGFPNMLFKNLGNKSFISIGAFSGITYKAYSLAASFGDVNNDGLLDIYAGHYIEDVDLIYDNAHEHVTGFNHDCHPNKFYINNGDWTFSEISSEMGLDDEGCALATMITDYDNDSDLDILVANDFGDWILPNALFSNNGDGSSFDEVGDSTGMDVQIYGMGITAGDFDNDMDLDYYITNIGQNVLLENDGTGKFNDVGKIVGADDTYSRDEKYAVGWGTSFMDLDNDMDLDLYVVNGYVPAAPSIDNSKVMSNSLYENDGTGSFNKIENGSPVESERWGRGLTSADIDGDGDLDFLVVNLNRQATSDTIQAVQLFRNDNENNNNWFAMKLVGDVSNMDGLGSRIEIKIGDQSSLREASGGYGTHTSQHSSVIHFGLGSNTMIDSIVVRWPSGFTQIIENTSANQILTVFENNLPSSTQEWQEIKEEEILVYPNPFHNSTNLKIKAPNISFSTIKIADQLGRIVFQKKYNSINQEKALDWTSPGEGVYFLRITTGKKIINKTLFSN